MFALELFIYLIKVTPHRRLLFKKMNKKKKSKKEIEKHITLQCELVSQISIKEKITTIYKKLLSLYTNIIAIAPERV